MIFSNQIGIIADDLTGANDTALQFQKRGVNTNIILDYNEITQTSTEMGVWAASTESRNIDVETACQRVEEAVHAISTSLNIEHFYKKIDSTMRGNIGPETLRMIEVLEMDAAVLIPAFPSEGRITVGGYHLLKGIPIGRTEYAQDPHNPILESHVPTILKNQLKEKEDLVAHIELKTIMNGAGPILMKMNDLIKSGKKLIVADAASIVDIEQIILAINKSGFNILPAGTAAAASVLSAIWLPDETNYVPRSLPKLPKLIVSGSATGINSNQIEKLKNSDDSDNIYEIALTEKNILEGVQQPMVDNIVNCLGQENTVLVHSSYLVDNFDGFSDDSLNAELTRTKFAGKITDFLAELTKRVLAEKNVLLVALGGETSYKCCRAINALELSLIDEVLPAIPLCIDRKDQLIITKSGNLGNSVTLIDIIKYINRHEQL